MDIEDHDGFCGVYWDCCWCKGGMGSVAFEEETGALGGVGTRGYQTWIAYYTHGHGMFLFCCNITSLHVHFSKSIASSTLKIVFSKLREWGAPTTGSTERLLYLDFGIQGAGIGYDGTCGC
jgi:hypothetical protein